MLADVNTLRKHLESRHGILPPPMGTKGRVSPGNTVAPPFYPCTLCGRQLKNRHTLSAHMKKVHDSDKRQDLWLKAVAEAAYCHGASGLWW
jgi:hypothetical protein